MMRALARLAIDGATSYLVALRISAAAAMPASFSMDDLQAPAPIIRTDPSYLPTADFDQREIVSDPNRAELVLVIDHGYALGAVQHHRSGHSLN